MKRRIQIGFLLAILLTFCSRSIAQPAITKTQIPKSISRSLRIDIESLYDQNPVERAKAAERLGDYGNQADPAIPFLISLLEDNTLVDPWDDHFRMRGTGVIITIKTSPALKASRTLVHIGEASTPALIA